MPSSYSTNLKIELQATGENAGTWGTITNTNLGTTLEQAIVGYGNPNFGSDANLTLSYTDDNAAQAARALVLNVTSSGSLTATREMVVPTIQKQYIVQNNTTGSQSITVKTSAGTGITVPNGLKAHLYVDGTNVIQMFDFVDVNGGAIDGTPIGANSASTGAFTTLSSTGNTTIGSDASDTVTVNADVASNLIPSADDSYDLGAVGSEWKDLFVDGTANIDSLVADTADINGGTLDNVQIGESVRNSGKFTTLDANGNVILGSDAADTVTVNADVASNVIPSADNTYDLGASGSEWKDLYVDGTGYIDAVSGDTATFSSTVTLSGGTANGVLYLNGSKEATSGSAITYDGTTFKADSAAVFNDSGADVDFRVEGDTDSNLLFVDASTDRVGMGIATPAEKLHLFGSSSATSPRILVQSHDTASATAGITFYGRDASNVNFISGLATSGSALTFLTNNTLQATLTSSGNLGIGTSSPGQKLVVAGNIQSDAWLGRTNTSAPTADAAIFRPADGTLAFCTSSNERARITSGGAFLVKADGADSTFTSSGQIALKSSGNNPYISWHQSTGARLGYLQMQNGGASTLSVDANQPLVFQTNATERARIDSSGNVAIGQTTALSGGAAARWLTLGTGGGTSYSGGIAYAINGTLQAYHYVDTDGLFAHQVVVNNGQKFLTNNTERARITSDGRFCVNATATKFTSRGIFASVSGAQGNALEAETETTANYPLVAVNKSTSGDNSFVYFGTEAAGTARGSINYNRAGGLVAYNTTSDYRAKDITGPIEDAGSTIDALKVYTGKMKDATVERPMLIAHEAQEVAPYAVTGEKDAVNEDGTPKYQQIDHSSLVPLLIAEIQSLRARVAALEAK